MCKACETVDFVHGESLGRRAFLAGAAAAAASLGLTKPGFGLEAKAPPKPDNVLSPEAALTRLMAGNARYVKGVAKRHDFLAEREALVGGQNPFAGVLSCADSRVAPEYAFDSARGDLFVVRVAGNFVNDDNLASFEYGVAVLKTPLIMVLGHANCGAIDATIKSLKDGTVLPGHLPSLVNSLAPAVKAAAGRPGDPLEEATKQNVRMNVERLKAATPVLSAAVQDQTLRVVGAYYNLKDGKVELLG